MEEITRIELPWPPSLNHYYRHVGSRVLISRDGRKYRELVTAKLAVGQVRKMNCRLALTIDAYPPDNRRRDVDNLLKVTFDALVAGGLMEDDSLVKCLKITMREPFTGGLLYLEAKPFQVK